MKTCVGCKYADWQKTAGGRLHPGGNGKCTFKIPVPVLPAAFYWIGGSGPTGGIIRRKDVHTEHCPCWSPEPRK